MNSDKTAWWKGARGEWYVVVQVALFLLLIFGPRSFYGWPGWPYTLMHFGTIAGTALLFLGAVLSIAGLLQLGRRNLTAVPYPRDNAHLVETGPYHFVRHPIYSGGIFAAFGWAFFVHGWLTLAYALIILIFFDIKSRREEEFLKEKFPEYTAYQKRVSKLIPFLY